MRLKGLLFASLAVVTTVTTASAYDTPDLAPGLAQISIFFSGLSAIVALHKGFVYIRKTILL